MSRPKSMPDFTALMDASAPIFEKRIHTRRALSPERRAEQPRKRQSFSLATGLIMKADLPKNMGPVSSPRKLSQERKPEEPNKGPDEPGNLFYAYALRVCNIHSNGDFLLSSCNESDTRRRATMPTPNRTCSHLPRPPSARNGGLLSNASTLTLRDQARNSSFSRAKTWNTFKTIPSSFTSDTSGFILHPTAIARLPSYRYRM